MTLINSSGKAITVDNDTYNEIRNCYEEGVWSVIVKDLSGNPHSVIIPDQTF